jgi:hypothetical protein
MKNYIAIVLSLIALGFSIVTYLKVKELMLQPTVIDDGTADAPMIDGDASGGLAKAGGVQLELANEMGAMQRHINKLWFAGINNNWELSQFYVHEIEESMEKIELANVYEDGIALSPLIRNLGLKSLEPLKVAIEKKDTQDFEAYYDLLVTNCNNCHNTVKHGFIKIQRPTKPVFDNQVYSASK